MTPDQKKFTPHEASKNGQRRGTTVAEMDRQLTSVNKQLKAIKDKKDLLGWELYAYQTPLDEDKRESQLIGTGHFLESAVEAGTILQDRLDREVVLPDAPAGVEQLDWAGLKAAQIRILPVLELPDPQELEVMMRKGDPLTRMFPDRYLEGLISEEIQFGGAGIARWIATGDSELGSDRIARYVAGLRNPDHMSPHEAESRLDEIKIEEQERQKRGYTVSTEFGLPRTHVRLPFARELIEVENELHEDFPPRPTRTRFNGTDQIVAVNTERMEVISPDTHKYAPIIIVEFSQKPLFEKAA